MNADLAGLPRSGQRRRHGPARSSRSRGRSSRQRARHQGRRRDRHHRHRRRDRQRHLARHRHAASAASRSGSRTCWPAPDAGADRGTDARPGHQLQPRAGRDGQRRAAGPDDDRPAGCLDGCLFSREPAWQHAILAGAVAVAYSVLTTIWPQPGAALLAMAFLGLLAVPHAFSGRYQGAVALAIPAGLGAARAPQRAARCRRRSTGASTRSSACSTRSGRAR